jgi:hypothetical protein
MPDTETAILIQVPTSTGIAHEENGQIVRVVGNSIAYVNLPSGNAFAFSAEDIQQYAGETLSSLGVRKGATVHVMPNADHLSVLLNR